MLVVNLYAIINSFQDNNFNIINFTIGHAYTGWKVTFGRNIESQPDKV